MNIRYVAIKDTKNGSDGDACAFNSAILGEGLAGISLSDAGEPFFSEKMDYQGYLPLGHYVSSAERYVNGAKNLFVRNRLHKITGYLIIRPGGIVP